MNLIQFALIIFQQKLSKKLQIFPSGKLQAIIDILTSIMDVDTLPKIVSE